MPGGENPDAGEREPEAYRLEGHEAYRPDRDIARIRQTHHDREYQYADHVVEDRRTQDGDALRRAKTPQVAYHPHGDSY